MGIWLDTLLLSRALNPFLNMTGADSDVLQTKFTSRYNITFKRCNISLGTSFVGTGLVSFKWDPIPINVMLSSVGTSVGKSFIIKSV